MVELAVIFITLGAAGLYAGLSYIQIFMVSLFFGVGFYLLYPYKRSLIIGVILVALCFTGAVLVSTGNSVTPSEFLGKRDFIAEVVSLEKKLDSTTLVVRDEVYDERIQVTLYEHMAVLPGDRVQVKGIIEQPQDFVTDTGRMFEYRNYLVSKKIRAVSTNAELVLIQEGGWSIARVMTVARYDIVEILRNSISFPADGVAAGMVFGYKGGIPKEIEELFRTTGVLHTLVLSGYNITLLVGFLGLLLQRIPQQVRILTTFIAIVSLILISGADVASIRAGVMGSIGLLSILTLRQYSALRALTISYLLFFLWSPTTLFVDPGFHLSFLATFCMITVIPKIELLFQWIPKTAHINIRELVMLSITLPVFMIPYTMYFSGVVQLAALPANIVLGIVTPVVMIATPLVVVLSFIPVLASVGGLIVSTLLDFTTTILRLLDQLPQYNTPELGSWSVVGIYSIVFFFLFKKELKSISERVRSSLLPQTNSFER